MDAQAFLDTAEGAHKEIENILQRMRELAVQASNDTNDATDRDNLDTEFASLIVEIDRISDVTEWAGKSLMAADGSFTFQIGSGTAAADSLTVVIQQMGTDSMGSTSTSFVATAHVSTADLAATAIDALDAAIQVVNSQRASLGSYSNRLDHTVANLTNVSTNLQAGLGRIEDADFAAETTNLAKTQILQQASTAMLAQANASKQNVLSLLQG
jgi:flagellin